MSEPKPNTPTHRLYFIRHAEEERAKRWLEIGAGWANEDGSMTVIMDRMPYQGFPENEECKLVIQPR